MNSTTLHELITTGLHRRAVTATQDGDDLGGKRSWLTINLPDGTAIWTSDHDGSVDTSLAEAHGLSAIHHLGDPYDAQPSEEITLFDHKLDRRSNRAKALADMVDTIATYVTNWPNSPAARHPERRVTNGIMNLPTRLLRRGDVIVHTATGHESVVTTARHLGRGEYKRTARTITPATRGPMTSLPTTWWQFPTTLRHSGSTLVPVAAHRHVDPDTLPRIPYPPVPASFADGDHVVHGDVIWERIDGGWFNHIRSPHTQPASDETILRLFTEDSFLRSGIPAHQPAAN
ncbi:hypothetical protein [Kitasatospora sp. NPDC058478]|uniref:hypothetical protein n=1 Tax=unclassified Kitasatospora TaxID=2633591 RepID=UPI00365A483F